MREEGKGGRRGREGGRRGPGLEEEKSSSPPLPSQGARFLSAQLQLHTYNTTAAPVFFVPILPGALCVGYRSLAGIGGGGECVAT